MRMSLGHFQAAGQRREISPRADPRSDEQYARGGGGKLAAGTAPLARWTRNRRMSAGLRTPRLLDRRIASITETHTGRLLSNVAAVALLEPTDPDVFLHVPAQRSRVTLRRGGSRMETRCLPLASHREAHGHAPWRSHSKAHSISHISS